MGQMSTTFPRVKRSERGYSVEQVEDFLEDARIAYSVEPGAPTGMTSTRIRHTAFSLEKGGYSTTAVDTALERLEDAFAAREREVSRRNAGDQAWVEETRAIAQEVVDRLDRPAGQKFQRVNLLVDGYDQREVDSFARRLIAYFRSGKPLSIEDVRTVAFRPRRGGYREAQVDLLLDSVISVMQAVR